MNSCVHLTTKFNKTKLSSFYSRKKEFFSLFKTPQEKKETSSQWLQVGWLIFIPLYLVQIPTFYIGAQHPVFLSVRISFYSEYCNVIPMEKSEAEENFFCSVKESNILNGVEWQEESSRRKKEHCRYICCEKSLKWRVNKFMYFISYCWSVGKRRNLTGTGAM